MTTTKKIYYATWGLVKREKRHFHYTFHPKTSKTS